MLRYRGKNEKMGKKLAIEEMEETVERLKDLESQNERKYRKMIVRQSMPSIRSDLTKSTKLP
jgi:hypothetical protein